MVLYHSRISTFQLLLLQRLQWHYSVGCVTQPKSSSIIRCCYLLRIIRADIFCSCSFLSSCFLLNEMHPWDTTPHRSLSTSSHEKSSNTSTKLGNGHQYNIFLEPSSHRITHPAYDSGPGPRLSGIINQPQATSHQSIISVASVMLVL